MITKIINRLQKKYAKVECYLFHRNVFELLCATCLSAQCTDARVNMVTPRLFEKYPDPSSLSQANLQDLELIVKSCGFYKVKARNLRKMAQGLVLNYGGQVPDTVQDLVTLAGVGRKTANVVLSTWFDKADGIVVDTHVSRISRLLGLTQEKSPEKIEQDLNKIIPRKFWHNFSLWLIALGREICIANRPRCSICFLRSECKTGSGKKIQKPKKTKKS